MSLLFYLLTDIIHFVKMVLVEELFFRFPNRNSKYKIIIYILIIIGIIANSIGSYLIDNTAIRLVMYISTVVSLSLVLYRDKIYRLVLSAIWIMFVSSLFDVMSTVLVSTIIDALNCNVTYLEKLFASMFSLMIIIATGAIFKKKSKIGIKDIRISNLVIFSCIAIAEAFVVTLMASVFEEQGTDNLLFLGALCFVVLGTFLMLAFLIVLFVQRNESKEQEAVIKKYLNEQKNYYIYLELRERETKKFRHDIRSHMDTMCHLVKNQDYDEFIKYFDRVNTKIESFGNGITVYNGIADAIINQYYSVAQEMGINMKVGGRFPVECNVDAYDICTIFSNILSNAIEAATDTEEKLVILECRHTNDNELFISISNSFINVGQFKDGIIKSHKRDSDYHGYGMENVKDSVNKYDGFMNITIKENVFELKITLYY